MPGDERSQETGERLTPPPQEIALETLSRGEIEMIGLLPNASNYTFLTKVATGQAGETVLAVYKPRRGETPLWDFPDGTLCKREVAAFEVSGALGWPSVPPTVLRDGPEGEGSLQLFVDADPEHHYFTMQGSRDEEFMRIAAFDAVVNNADRKGGHCLLGAGGRIWIVDHGVCFAEEPKLRSVIWDFAGLPLPVEILADLEKLLTQMSSGGLRLRLTELLDESEVEATEGRIRELLAVKVFPEPRGRAYPWPPV